MALTITRKNVRPLTGAIVRQYVVSGAAVQAGDEVFIHTDDTVRLAQGNAAATAWARGVVMAANTGDNTDTSYAVGQSVAVCVFGPIAGYTGMDTTKALYTSPSSAGGTTQTKPTSAAYLNTLGYPIRTDVAFINPQEAEPTSL